MKKIQKTFLVLFMCSSIVSCNSQDKKKEQTPKTVKIEKTEGTNPKIKTKVNKQYDAKGNLIKFDSTYSYFYTSKGRDSTKISMEKAFKEFKTFYNDDIMSDVNKHFEDIFLNDSLFKYDFMNEDFFRKRFELNVNKMHQLFREMDSLKTSYFKKIQSEKSTDKQKSKN